MSETESQGTDFKDDASTTSTHGSESPMMSDNEMETEENKQCKKKQCKIIGQHLGK